MVYRILGVIIFIILSQQLNAEEVEEGLWEKSFIGGMNVTQVGLDNWVSGGESIFAWQMNLSYRFLRKGREITWSNTGKLRYGTSKTDEVGTRKSADEIKIESVWTYKMKSFLNPFIAVTGETQLAGGYYYTAGSAEKISAFMDPGYVRESVGVGYAFRERIKMRTGLALKQTVTSTFSARYTDNVATETMEKLRTEIGADFVADIFTKVTETSQYESKLEIFTAFRSINETDVYWDNTLTVKISDFMNMNIGMTIIYDKDLSIKRQIKQSMAFGVNYSFL